MISKRAAAALVGVVAVVAAHAVPRAGLAADLATLEKDVLSLEEAEEPYDVMMVHLLAGEKAGGADMTMYFKGKLSKDPPTGQQLAGQDVINTNFEIFKVKVSLWGADQGAEGVKKELAKRGGGAAAKVKFWSGCPPPEDAAQNASSGATASAGSEGGPSLPSALPSSGMETLLNGCTADVTEEYMTQNLHVFVAGPNTDIRSACDWDGQIVNPTYMEELSDEWNKGLGWWGKDIAQGLHNMFGGSILTPVADREVWFHIAGNAAQQKKALDEADKDRAAKEEKNKQMVIAKSQQESGPSGPVEEIEEA